MGKEVGNGLSSIWVKFSKYVEQLKSSHHIFDHWESVKKRQPNCILPG